MLTAGASCISFLSTPSLFSLTSLCVTNYDYNDHLFYHSFLHFSSSQHQTFIITVISHSLIPFVSISPVFLQNNNGRHRRRPARPPSSLLSPHSPLVAAAGADADNLPLPLPPLPPAICPFRLSLFLSPQRHFSLRFGSGKNPFPS
ncbi:hypothetical protein D9758_014030 [Tetrapyrgos nigripes]|uniref:Uncharacterized protein n=1 Tax=Tetrapyrgos nigripes TaxID=182062 RepID=A0A8H5CXN9_9AGAR|nr:hypothetical protein D9758_014030 [Tetrapyrgos nigripes]